MIDSSITGNSTLPARFELAGLEKFSDFVSNSTYKALFITQPGKIGSILNEVLEKAFPRLAIDGLIFIYGDPDQLPKAAEAIEKHRALFRYWIAVKTEKKENDQALIKSEHKGLLLYTRRET